MTTSNSYIDWTDGELVERVPGPPVRSTTGRPNSRVSEFAKFSIVASVPMALPQFMCIVTGWLHRKLCPMGASTLFLRILGELIVLLMVLEEVGYYFEISAMNQRHLSEGTS